MQRQAPLHKLSFTAIITASLLCSLSLSAAVTDPNNNPVPVIDTEAPTITANATDLSIPIPLTATLPIVTPSLDSAVDGIVKTGIEVTDKVINTDTPTSFTFTPTGEIGPLGPGQHTITWTASDLGLNTVSATQTINVLPSVNLSLDQEVSEGGVATVTAQLNGPAPTNTSFTLSYTVGGTAAAGADYNQTDNAFTFNSGATSDSISFAIVDDADSTEGDETIIITLAAPATTEAFNGHAEIHTITIKDKGTLNHSPLAQLHAEQNNKTTRIITTDAGKVTICAMPDCTAGAYDADGDTPRYDWSASDNALIPITGTTGKTFEFEPQGLNPGFYTIRLTVSDTAGGASSHDLLLNLQESEFVLTEADSDDDKSSDINEGFYDNDNDGIPNFLDAIENNPSLMQAYAPYLFDSNLKIEDSYTIDSIELSWSLSSSASNLTVYPLLIATSPGLHINIGPTAYAAGKIYARLETNIAENLRGASVPDNVISSDGQVIDIEITHLNSAGDTAQIVLPQAAPTPNSQNEIPPRFIVFSRDKTWQDFNNDGTNQILTSNKTNSYCPDLTSTASYTNTTLAKGDECLLIEVQDGGDNDYDGVANGTIRLMGAVFITSESIADNDQAEGGIFTGNTESVLEGQNKLDLGTGNGGSLGFISLFGLLLASLRRNFSKKNQ